MLLAPEIIDERNTSRKDVNGVHSAQSALLRDEDAKLSRSRPQLSSEEMRWGVILAGGDGSRLRSMSHLIYGDDRPKQFCRFLGRQTLLEQTRQRTARSIRAEQTIIALTEAHRKFYEDDLAASVSPRLVQPQNRGTAPPIILSLLHIATQTPGALVALFPSDHYYSNEAAFTASLESAFRLADTHPDSIVLLGAQPRGAEVDLGWLDLGRSAGENLFRVRGFEEKPSHEAAERLLRSGALWNTFVMVGTTMALLWMALVTLPELVTTLDESLPLLGQNGELRVPSSLYDAIPRTDFSSQVLVPNAHRLLALRLQQLDWYDLGLPDRVISAVSARGQDRPPWIHAWEIARRSTRDPIFLS